MEHIYRNIKEILEKEGVDVIATKGLSGPASETIGFEDKFNTYIYLRFWKKLKRIDMANLTIRKDLRRKGILTKLLKYLETIPDYDRIKIENCMTDEMEQFAIKNNFKSDGDEYCPSYYKERGVNEYV